MPINSKLELEDGKNMIAGGRRPKREWPEDGLMIRLPAWLHQAECAKPEHADVNFFPSQGRSSRSAKEICESCPVRAECKAWAEQFDTKAGIWGGESLGSR